MATSDFKDLKFIWLDGKFVKWQDARLHVLSHALLYGTGVFEGIRCYNTPAGPVLFRLHDHLERLFFSARAMKMRLSFSAKEYENACIELVNANCLTDCYLRLVAMFGYGKIGLSSIGVPVNSFIAAWPQENYLGQKAKDGGIKLMTSRLRRVFPSKELANAKVTGDYVASMLAKTEAIEAGFDEALMLDLEGDVAECSVENFFIVKNKTLLTPPPKNALDGITRRSVIEIAKDVGIAVNEKFFGLSEVYSADEAFMTGTSAEVTPVVQVDGMKIDKGKPGEITKMLQRKFFDACRGNDTKYAKWLARVENIANDKNI